MRFNDLKIGDRFCFGSEIDEFSETCIKTEYRHYKSIWSDLNFIVSDSNCLVSIDIPAIFPSGLCSCHGYLVCGGPEDRPKCPACESEIDPDTCWCGDSINHHAWNAGHMPIPMGCECFRSFKKL